MNVRQNFRRKRGRRRLQQKQRVVFQLQRLLRRQHRQSAQLQLTSVLLSTVEGISDPQPSPEHLRQQQEDQSSLSASLDEEIDRENSTAEPSLENITITDEVLHENEKSASEETESPGLDFEDTDTYRWSYEYSTMYGNPYLKAFRFRFVNSGEKKEEWVRESKWYTTNWNKMSLDDFHEGIMMSAHNGLTRAFN